MRNAPKRAIKSSPKSPKGVRKDLDETNPDNPDFQNIKDQEGAGSSSAKSNGDLFPIIGVGASAGGLEAFTRLVEHLPVVTTWNEGIEELGPVLTIFSSS